MITAGDIMHRDLTAVMEHDRIVDVIHILTTQRITGLPVVRNNWELVGFISETDVLLSSLPTYLEILAQTTFFEEEEDSLLRRIKDIGEETVMTLMNHKAHAVEESASLMSVADLIIRGKIKRLPVIRDGRLVGIIDRGNFFEYMLEAAKNEKTL